MTQTQVWFVIMTEDKNMLIERSLLTVNILNQISENILSIVIYLRERLGSRLELNSREVGSGIDNKALKRDWKRTKNLRANSGKLGLNAVTSRRIIRAAGTPI